MTYDSDDFDYDAMATGHMRERGTWTEWEDWFTERGMGVPAGRRKIRGIFDRLGTRFFLLELERIWSYVTASKLKDPRGFFVNLLEGSADDLEETLRKVGRHEELQKLRGRNMDPASPARQERIRDEYICTHMQERRTIEWMMAKERLTRTEILAIWDKRRSGMDLPGLHRQGPDAWEAVIDAPANWRRDDEGDALKARGEEIAKAAAIRKQEKRAALGISGTDPEEISVGDVFPGLA